MGHMDNVLANLKRKKDLLRASPQAEQDDCPRVTVVENSVNGRGVGEWCEAMFTPHGLHVLDIASLEEVVAVRWEDVTRLYVDQASHELELHLVPGGYPVLRQRQLELEHAPPSAGGPVTLPLPRLRNAGLASPQAAKNHAGGANARQRLSLTNDGALRGRASGTPAPEPGTPSPAVLPDATETPFDADGKPAGVGVKQQHRPAATPATPSPATANLPGLCEGTAHRSAAVGVTRSFDPEKKEFIPAKRGAARRTAAGLVVRFYPEDAVQVTADLTAVWDAFREYMLRALGVEYPPGTYVTTQLPEPNVVHATIVEHSPPGPGAREQMVPRPVLDLSTPALEFIESASMWSSGQGSPDAQRFVKFNSRTPSLQTVNAQFTPALTPGGQSAGVFNFATRGSLDLEGASEASPTGGTAPKVWLPTYNTGLNMAQLMRLSHYNIRQVRAAGLSDSFVQDNINVGALREVRTGRLKPRLTREQREAIMKDYQRSHRQADAAGVNAELDKLLAEAKLMDPLYVDSLGRSAAATANAVADAKESWDLAQAEGEIDALVGEYWSSHPQHREALRDVRMGDPERTAVSLSHSGLDDDILRVIIEPLRSNTVLTSLTLAHNPITDDAVATLCAALFPSDGPACTAITDISLEGCELLTARTAEVVLHAARGHPQLVRVVLPDEVGTTHREELERTLMLNLVATSAGGMWDITCDA